MQEVSVLHAHDVVVRLQGRYRDYSSARRCLGEVSQSSISLSHSEVVVWKRGAHHELDLDVDALVDEIDVSTQEAYSESDGYDD